MEAGAVVSGAVADLMLVCSRRLPLDDARVKVSGDAALLGHWLAHMAFWPRPRLSAGLRIADSRPVAGSAEDRPAGGGAQEPASVVTVSGSGALIDTLAPHPVKRLSIVIVLPSKPLLSNTPVAAYELFTLLTRPAEVRVRV